jgi:hypothetical protein
MDEELALVPYESTGFATAGDEMQAVRHEFLRGPRPLWFGEAAYIARSKRDATDYGICWGGIHVPSKAGQNHFCVIGVPGSGKTVLLRLMMQSVLPLIGMPCKNAAHQHLCCDGKTVECKPHKHRAFIYDILKKEFLGCLRGMGVTCDVTVLDPFNVNGTYWDIAKDVDRESRAWEFASTLIPDRPGNKGENAAFFVNATRICVFNVLNGLMRTRPGDWSFRDFIFVMLSVDRIRQLLRRFPDAAESLHNLEGNSDTFHNIISDIETYIRPLALAASAWHDAHESGREGFSFYTWAASEGIVTIGGDEDYRASVDPLNRVMFGMMAKVLLAGENNPPGEEDKERTWIFLDELANAGELAHLPQLMSAGRTKGVCVVIGYQSTSGVKRVFSEDVFTELMEVCPNKAVLRCLDKTAEWASKLFGKTEFYEVNVSKQIGTSQSVAIQSGSSTTTGWGSSSQSSTGGGPGGASSGSSVGYSNHYSSTGSSSTTFTYGSSQSTTTSKARHEKELVLASQIANLPATDHDNGMSGFMMTHDIGVYGFHLKSTYLFGDAAGNGPRGLMPIQKEANDYMVRPQKPLLRWSTEEYERFGLSPALESGETPHPTIESAYLPDGLRRE